MNPDRFGPLRKMVVEDKVSGTGLIEAVKRKAVSDTYTRALDVVPSVAPGLVVLPNQRCTPLATNRPS